MDSRFAERVSEDDAQLIVAAVNAYADRSVP